MQNEPPPKTTNEKIKELLAQENLPDEIFEDLLTKLIKEKENGKSDCSE